MVPLNTNGNSHGTPVDGPPMVMHASSVKLQVLLGHTFHPVFFSGQPVVETVVEGSVDVGCLVVVSTVKGRKFSNQSCML